jgi:AcrR family transcriptional regulator
VNGVAPKIVDQAQKKKNILDAASVVFARAGYHDATISDVAAQAGIGKGTVYEYFNSKEQIFFALVDMLEDQITAAVKSQVSELTDPREKLMQLIFTTCSLFERMPELGPLWAENMKLQNRNKKAKSRTESGLYKVYKEVIESGMDTGVFMSKRGDAEVALVVSMMEGLLLQKARNSGKMDISSMAETACAIVFEGILK